MQFIQYECINLFLKYLLFKKRKYFYINLKMCAGAICLKIKKKANEEDQKTSKNRNKWRDIL